MMEKCTLILFDKLETLSLGAKVAKICTKSCVIYLDGYIGTGKSTFCQGFLRKLGYIGHIRSPTYTLIESYFLSNKEVYHLDCYRLNSEEELINIGIQDCCSKKSILLIEWPKKKIRILPDPDILISISYHNVEQFRKVIIKSYSDFGQIVINNLLHNGNFIHEI